MVLPNGEVARASKTSKPDLFWGAACAFGTLGVVTLLEIQLRDAQPFVELTFRRISSLADVVKAVEAETAPNTANDYVDAITFSLDSTLLCTGRLVPTVAAGHHACQFLRRRDPWFSVHAGAIEKQLKKSPSSTTVTEYVPLTDYLFRYDRGSFWTARWAFRYFVTPFNRVTRFVLDPLLHTRVMYRALHQSRLSDFYVIQDVGIPYGRAEEFAEWLDKCLDVYPLWLCPLSLKRDEKDSGYGLHAEFADPETKPMLNFGVWGPASGDRTECVRKNRELEKKVHELGGKKWLYAHAYYTEDEFWARYGRDGFDRLREKYHATYLPSVYDKVKVDVDAEEAATRATLKSRLSSTIWRIWPVAGLYGVYKALLGGDYLLQEKKPENWVGDVKKRP